MTSAPEILTPIKAIRANCLECCCGQRKEVRECRISNCPLHPYRMGRRPARASENPGLGGTLFHPDGKEDE